MCSDSRMKMETIRLIRLRCASVKALQQSWMFSASCLPVYYQDKPYTQEVLDNTAMWYTETTPFTTAINGVECQGFHAKDEDIFNAGQFYEYDFIFLPIDDGHHIQFMIMTAAPGNADVVSRDDADVQLIMSNFAVD